MSTPSRVFCIWFSELSHEGSCTRKWNIASVVKEHSSSFWYQKGSIVIISFFLTFSKSFPAMCCMLARISASTSCSLWTISSISEQSYKTKNIKYYYCSFLPILKSSFLSSTCPDLTLQPTINYIELIFTHNLSLLL
jgi:hypothetical protein